MWCISLTHHSCDGVPACVFPHLVDDGAELLLGTAAAACLVAQTAGACAFDVHDVELDREVWPNTAGCLSAGTGDWASGRVDVPGSVPLAEPCEMQRLPAASSVATESSSAQFSFQAMVISLGGKTLIDATPDAPVLLLVEDVARLLGLPDTCFYLALGSRVLRDYMSLIRVCARMRGECNRPVAVLVAAVLAVAATLGNGPAPTRSAGPIGVGQLKRSASGVDPRRGMGSLKSRVGLLTLLRGGRHVNNIIWGDQLGRHLVSLPPCPKRQPRLHERRRLRRPHLAFPPLSLSPRCRLLNFLKGTWMVSSFWSFKIGWLSRRWFVHRKRRMLCSVNGLRRTKPRISKISWIRGFTTFGTIWLWPKLRLRKNRQRVLILQGEWQALYDQAGKETDEKVEQQLSHNDLESDGTEATDDERIPLGDSDGFLTVLSRNRRMKHRGRSVATLASHFLFERARCFSRS